ncbi:PfaB family protein [Calothrix sp. 336/3]|uniref:PfaB family protein n=1 Tax=Calothrix sp. 336/3 TaxID=1337936 RepID=UPI0004E313DB|nr:PfaB family protein [Calothrix sp. 336/3]AKG23073.1 beta-ketoacyl synthase [Calothrix sp. 336/3]
MEKIAIIGFGCLFPDAKNPEEFWHNLIQQKDSTSDISIEETGVEPGIFYDATKGKVDKIYSLKGAFIRNFKFDPTGYKLPPQFLETLDNTFKWSLYVAKQALQHSGYLDKESVLERCGVILGSLSLPTKYSNQVFAPIYQQILSPAVQELLQQDFQLPGLPISTDAANHNGMISGLPAAIIAQALSLSSTHLCIDAACSSPQYSIRLASHYLWTHKTDLMLAGGISCADPLFIRMLFSGIQGYPENDISRPLDKFSRGMLTAEGVGMVVLKRYSDAIRDGDRVYATICGNGLSNDGKGKHLLSPNSKGQTLAFERAYQEAQINPKDIDYLECHATGTLLGDTTEFQSVESFFGKYQATPFLGSVKSNVGHLLTAAGSVSLIKVLLSMSRGVIPATINITEPMGAENSVISPQRIVTSTTNWAKNSSVKRAAISAFGLGGTNAHIVLEQRKEPEVIIHSEPLETAKIAIVGMDAFFGECDGLDAFERSIYEGKQHFIPLPEKRWHGVEQDTNLLKNYGFVDGKAPLGAYIQDFTIDTISSKIPPNEVEKLNPQQLLLLKVAERALKDAGIKSGTNVAVIIAAETEFSVHQLQQRWDLSWQVKEGLKAENISLPVDKTTQLETILQDAVHQPVDSSEFVSYISNIMASRISALWDFTAPAFTITAGENSAFKAIEIAQHLLTTGEAEAVLVGAIDLAGSLENVVLRQQFAPINTGINTLSYDQKANGWTVGEGAGAIVVKLHEAAKKQQEKIYAVVDGMSFVQKYNSQLDKADISAVHQVSQQALTMAGVKASEVNYLEVFASGIIPKDAAEIQGLIRAYPGNENGLSCAIGSVKSNIGHTYVASGMASLIKTALCLYYRYIPATPQWTGVKNKADFMGSCFYVASESRPWFLDKNAAKRIAAVNSMGIDGNYAHLIMSEAGEEREVNNRFLQQTPFYLFPINGTDRQDIISQLSQLETHIQNGVDLATAASSTFQKFQEKSSGNYTLAILAHNQKEILREITSAHKGINQALDTGEDWQTPLGSFFTAKPLGKTGEVAYIYPAAVNSYTGISRNLYRLFPKIHDDIAVKTLRHFVADISRLVFPRSLNKLSSRQLETLEQLFLDDSLAIFDVDMLYTRFITQVMRDELQVKPKFAFGYSLGETSMMSAMGVWDNFTQGIITLHESPLFADRLSGKKQSVREFWQMSNSQDNNFWANYVLMATPQQVRECLKQETKVYLTQINTPEEVVIAGEPSACERVINTIGCNALRAPFDHVIHCPAMQSEYGEIARVNTLPMQKNLPPVTIYSAANYAPVQLESTAIATHIAQGLCQQLDFPRLVNQVYNAGARIFIETGAGNICSRWIDKILTDKEHITIPLNRRGLDDHSGIMKAVAKLVSHQVNLNLSLLYPPVTETQPKSKFSLKKVTLGGNSFTEKILTPENKQLFHNTSQKILPPISNFPTAPQPEIKLPPIFTTSPTEIMASDIIDHNLEPEKEVELISATSAKLSNHSDIPTTHYEYLNHNNTTLHKTHLKFLKTRQESSQQMSEIMQLQLACVEKLLSQ